LGVAPNDRDVQRPRLVADGSVDLRNAAQSTRVKWEIIRTVKSASASRAAAKSVPRSRGFSMSTYRRYCKAARWRCT
jgi:hypothetical protein